MKPREIDRIIARESAELLEDLKAGVPGVNERLDDFLSESKRHVQHFLMIMCLDRELKHLDPDRKWGIEPEGMASPENVVPLAPAQSVTTTATRTARAAGPRRWRRRFFWSAAAVVLVSVVLAGSYWLTERGHAGQEYRTDVGEQRVIELADGSVVHLNTRSHLWVNLRGASREVRLVAGEALFKVQHEPVRPFYVRTDDATIQAIGTEFNVYRRPQGTEVAVLEGRVSVSSAPGTPKTTPAAARSGTMLSAGQEAHVSPSGAIETEETRRDIASLTAWRQRRLIFRGASLPEMIAEFNRYNRHPQFMLDGTLHRERKYSGIFDADDPESLATYLRNDGLQIERNGDRIVIQGSQARVTIETK